ncbi:MAG: hypothetical protein RE471_06030 [Ferroplasma sp.]|uniref:hypothetical protein n=1 Tax=Ferroplasma sp. TaxID=2591003 RepID=UPI00281545CD|nr:hypothetical protein [Ferroplasma sp.]WMT50539.1 MAG: hypothetical protein RE471_06030 [Ferroplasma sp.]
MISNEIIMERDIEYESVDCIATIRVKTQNEYIITILRIADKFGLLTPENLRNNLLPEQPLGMAENIIEHYKAIGFIEESGALTELGKMAVNGDVYMPEQGEYTIYATQDKLFNNPVIEISRIKRNENKEKSVEKPNMLVGFVSQPTIVLLDGHKEEVIIESISNKVQPIKSKGNFSVEARCNGNSDVTLREEGKPLYTFQNNLLKIDDVWNALIKSKSLKWKGAPLQNGILLLSYDSTRLEERKSFTRTIDEMKLYLSEFGTLKIKPITVNIQPLSQNDADLWAQDVIEDKLVDFLTEDKFINISEKVKKKFRVHIPKTPTRNDMITILYNKSIKNGGGVPREYWYLQAPVDLNMEVE